MKGGIKNMRSILKMNKRGQLAAVQGAIVSLVVIIALVAFMFLFTGKLKTQAQTDLGATSVGFLQVNATEAAATNVVTYLPYIIIALMIGLAIFALTRFLGGSNSFS